MLQAILQAVSGASKAARVGRAATTNIGRARAGSTAGASARRSLVRKQSIRTEAKAATRAAPNLRKIAGPKTTLDAEFTVRPARVPTPSTNGTPYTPRINVPSQPPPLPSVDNRRPPNRPNAPQPPVSNVGNVQPPPKFPEPSSSDLGHDLLRGMAFGAWNQASSFIPSTVWTVAITARGYRDTPIRTVLHYCLALAYGHVHQTRIGSTFINAKLFPMDNKVELTFMNSTQMMLEPTNIAIAALANGWKVPLNVLQLNLDQINTIVDGVRAVGNIVKNPAGIFELVGDVAGDVFEDAKKIFDIQKKLVGDVNRAVGPAGIWDMGQQNIFAGVPNFIMNVPGIEPYESMHKLHGSPDRGGDGEPMLTKTLAKNPQLRPVAKGQMHSSHIDLRSLVAQALYDPGVMPPVPNTNLALPNVKL